MNERPPPAIATSGALLIAVGANYAVECTLCAALIRSQRARGLDGAPMHVTLLTDAAAADALHSHELDRLGVYDDVKKLPEPQVGLQSGHMTSRMVAWRDGHSNRHKM